jgi:hypothetical protein
LSLVTATLRHLITALDLLDDAGVACHVSGGWAEDLLGLRPSGPHGDIDLIHEGVDWCAMDALLRNLPLGIEEVAAKRFAHKRAFVLDGICCEIVLVQRVKGAPVTLFWGDVPFHWGQPLLHDRPAIRDSHSFLVVSAANLIAARARHRETEPWRWRDPASLVAI